MSQLWPEIDLSFVLFINCFLCVAPNPNRYNESIETKKAPRDCMSSRLGGEFM